MAIMYYLRLLRWILVGGPDPLARMLRDDAGRVVLCPFGYSSACTSYCGRVSGRTCRCHAEDNLKQGHPDGK